MFMPSYVYMRVCMCVCVYVCVCVPSPMDSLLCLVCMVSVPTTAPMFAVVAVVARLYAEVCISLSRVWTVRTRAHTLPRLLSSSHPPPSLSLTLPPLSAEPLFLSSLLSGFLTPSHSAPPPHSLSLSPFSPHALSHSLPPSLQFPCFFIRGCSLPPSLPPTFTHKPRAWAEALVIQYEIAGMLIH